MARPKKLTATDDGLKFNRETALKLKVENKLSYAEIGATLGVSKQSVHQVIAPLLKDIEAAEEYKTKRADILANKQRILLTALDEAKIQNMSGRDLAIAAGVLFDKERLERGQSTGNISLLHRIIEESPDLPD